MRKIVFGTSLHQSFARYLCTVCILLILFLFNHPCEGQDSIQLSPVIINEQFFPIYKKVFDARDTVLISKKHYRDAGTFLDLHLPIYIRKYGPGLSYSLSVRGSNSAQVEVLWNGITLNSPMVGQSDLALMQFTEGSSITFDPQNYVYGLAGALSIMDYTPDSAGIYWVVSEKISSTRGHNFHAHLAKNHQERWKFSMDLHAANDKNHFYFEKAGEKIAITNNVLNQYQGKINLDFQPNKKHRFQLNTWLLAASREIPPSLYEVSSDAVQKDSGLRLLTSYTFIGKRSSFNAKAAILSDHLIYESLIKNISTDSKAIQFVQQLDWHFLFNFKHRMHWQFTNRRMNVNSNAYNEKVQIDDLNLSAEYKWRISDIQRMQGGIKLAYRNWDAQFKQAPYLHYQLQLNKNIQLHASIGQKFRFPGLNDLFWHQGGNAQLKPEEEFSYEAGIKWQANSKLRLENRSYRKKVNNWIQWLPVNGVFEASNIDKVVGAGMENSLEINGIQQNVQFSLLFLHQWVINEYGSGPNQGLQLIYTPRHQFKQNSSFSWRGFTCLIDQQWMARTYTTSDHSAQLKDYYLLNTTFEKRFPIKKFTLHSWIRINNILNTSYFSIENYVMPGRNFEFGIQLKNKTR